MRKIVTLFVMLVFSGSINADTPPEIQGVWMPDIEKSIGLMSANMVDIDIAFMKDRYLPHLKRTITKDQFITVSGKRVIKAGIFLKEKQGNKFVMVLTSKSVPDVTVTFIPKENGGYIMQSQNPSDGSDSVLWRKQ